MVSWQRLAEAAPSRLHDRGELRIPTQKLVDQRRCVSVLASPDRYAGSKSVTTSCVMVMVAAPLWGTT